MSHDVFGNEWYAKIALQKMGVSSENFRIYEVGWCETGGPIETWDTLEVIGAEFREARRGPNKGKLSILVPGTKRTAYIHVSERVD